jgi:hypothetical protein
MASTGAVSAWSLETERLQLYAEYGHGPYVVVHESSIALIRKLELSFANMITIPGEEHEICLYRAVLGT